MHLPGFNNDNNNSRPQFPNTGFSQPNFQPPSVPPPGYPSGAPARPPPSGFSIALSNTTPAPSPRTLGPPAGVDADGTSPVFFASVLLPSSVHPCKYAPHLGGVRYGYGMREMEHEGRYDVLPFVPEEMELVWTRDGRVPVGRRPVEGGYEEGGARLYHALATLQGGVKVPGKCGEHLSGANIPFGGQEVHVKEYEILCWRN